MVCITFYRKGEQHGMCKKNIVNFQREKTKGLQFYKTIVLKNNRTYCPTNI